MASQYDTNPFAEPETDRLNLFSQSELQPLPSAKNMDTYIPPGGKDIRTREKELKAREERLDKWEKELKKREAALAKTTLYLEPRNFPPFFPIIHHDIAGDMPDYLRFRARLALASWIGILVALFWNIVALTAAWVITAKEANPNGEGNLFGTWILLAVYVVAGWFGSYVLWYRPLYRALRRESAGRYIWFFLFYMVHIGFCFYAAIAPKIYFPVNALTGFISTIALIGRHPKAAIFYGVGTTLYTMETLLSIYLLNSIYMYFRGIGKAADMKRIANLKPAV